MLTILAKSGARPVPRAPSSPMGAGETARQPRAGGLVARTFGSIDRLLLRGGRREPHARVRCRPRGRTRGARQQNSQGNHAPLHRSHSRPPLASHEVTRSLLCLPYTSRYLARYELSHTPGRQLTHRDTAAQSPVNMLFFTRSFLIQTDEAVSSVWMRFRRSAGPPVRPRGQRAVSQFTGGAARSPGTRPASRRRRCRTPWAATSPTDHARASNTYQTCGGTSGCVQ